MPYGKKKLIIFGVSTLSGVVAGVVALIAVNASFLKAPAACRQERYPPPNRPPAQLAALAEPDYKAIAERNLFRAKLQVEIPKPKTEEELEEEALTDDR